MLSDGFSFPRWVAYRPMLTSYAQSFDAAYAVAHVAPPVNGRHILVAIIDVRPKLRLLLHAVQS